MFANVLLVDEINRAMPKTQSALLEAMAERQVTVDGVTRELPDPFLVLATENPIEQEGTFPLPEAQLDRFFLRTALGYPGVDDELAHREEQRYAPPARRAAPGGRLDDVHGCAQPAQDVYIDPVLHRWVIELVRATREPEGVAIGTSVRGQPRARAGGARVGAPRRARATSTPEDVERLFVPVLMHRVVFTPSFVARARATGGRRQPRSSGSKCLELAPRPGSEEDPLFEGGVRPEPTAVGARA